MRDANICFRKVADLPPDEFAELAMKIVAKDFGRRDTIRFLRQHGKNRPAWVEALQKTPTAQRILRSSGRRQLAAEQSETIEPLAIKVSVSADRLHVVLADGREIIMPLQWLPNLRSATARQRRDWRLIAGGVAITWPGIDEDVIVSDLLQGRIEAQRAGKDLAGDVSRRSSASRQTGPKDRQKTLVKGRSGANR